MLSLREKKNSSMGDIELLLIKDRLSLTDKFNNFKLFVWNPVRKEVLGRTGKSWAKILLFYFCFYTILGSIFATSVVVLLSTLDETVPMYHNKYSVMDRQSVNGKLVGVNPGLGFRPILDDHTSLIRIRSSESDINHPHNYRKYIDSLEQFFTIYDGEHIYIFGRKNPCRAMRNYEFDKGKPCVLLKLNKIYNWVPEAYEPTDQLPVELQPYEHIVREYSQNIFILCDGEFPVDRDLIGPIQYFSITPGAPGESSIGFLPFSFYPWKRQDDYLAPLVFAYFSNITTNVLVNVMCKAFAKNIYIDTLQRIGSVHFELMVE